MQNHLKDQTSPYLLQHAKNPVDWYPWCSEAFERAKKEDKPVFLSIGYSTCHWCHVMAHESFEDPRIAELLNRYFISVKVDKEERPDIDSIYMAVCQAFTGSGGWPMTIFLTPEQKPFFAGTYFPKTARYGQPGLQELLSGVHEKWINDRAALFRSADEVISFLERQTMAEDKADGKAAEPDAGDDKSVRLISAAVGLYRRSFDEEYGGFGEAPKFPTPHNLLFLMQYYEKNRDVEALRMAEMTLLQMYRGGLFDHIGGGFCRYSTDRYFLVPHFEKMLYDNALLILAYSKAYQLTGKAVYREVAERTADYIRREMTAPEGGFYSAQDADSEGVEGKYYLFTPSEIRGVLGEQKGRKFCGYFDITESGNFEGKSIPNLLKNSSLRDDTDLRWDDSGRTGNGQDTVLKAVYEYRRSRYPLHLDDKILTSWNALMIAAMCSLYRSTGKKVWLDTAMEAQHFIQNRLCEGDTLYVSCRKNQRGEKGFLDDYAFEIFALLALYEAALDDIYLDKARRFCKKVTEDFYDDRQGGFYLYGRNSEKLILRPKDTYDGAIFSGNSAMAYDLVRLYLITGEKKFGGLAERQLAFLHAEAERYPAGHAMYLAALSDYLDPPEQITIVRAAGEKKKADEETDNEMSGLACRIPLDSIVRVCKDPTEEYPLLNNRTTFYICRGHACQPPVNEW